MLILIHCFSKIRIRTMIINYAKVSWYIFMSHNKIDINPTEKCWINVNDVHKVCLTMIYIICRVTSMNIFEKRNRVRVVCVFFQYMMHLLYILHSNNSPVGKFLYHAESRSGILSAMSNLQGRPTSLYSAWKFVTANNVRIHERSKKKRL